MASVPNWARPSCPLLNLALEREAGIHGHVCSALSDRDTQLARLMKRNNLNREDAEARINAQLPLKDKARMANHVLDNSGEWSLTRRQAILLHAKLERSMEYLPLRLGFLTGLAGIASLLYLLTRYLLPSP